MRCGSFEQYPGPYHIDIVVIGVNSVRKMQSDKELIVRHLLHSVCPFQNMSRP